MRALATELRSEVDAAAARLRALDEASASADRGDGKWVRKEILGHLIDSAANNHQRFVRAPVADPFVWPAYEQNAWVSAQRYRDRAWTELVDLWAALNRHVAYAIESVPPSALQTRCIIGNSEPVTLEWLMRDYLRHLRHHLAQILPAGA
jgi:hypothetical protein